MNSTHTASPQTHAGNLLTVEEASLAAAGENLSTSNKRHSDNSIIHDSIAATLLTALALVVYLLLANKQTQQMYNHW